MSANDDEDTEIPGREVAYRLFAAEYDDASVSHTESDEERAPNYVIAPTGARINRLFAVGTLTEVTAVNDEMVRARVVDPTGAFVVYAGQYQPDELAFLEGIEPPAFVAVTGKARTFQPEDADQVYTSIRPESIATVDADTRDRWVVSAAEQTVDRVGTYAAAAESDARGDELTDALLEAGVEPGLAAGIPLAQDEYGTTPSYLAALRECALEAVEVVAGDRDQVSPFDAQPSEPAPAYEDATFESLSAHADVDLDALESVVGEGPAADEESEPVAATPGGSDVAAADEVSTESAAGTATSEDRGSELEVDAEIDAAGTGSETDADREPAASDVDSSSTSDAAAEAPSEPTAESDSESETDADEDELGDFDAGDAGMYEMDEEEREQLEEQFGAEFTTGSEVEEPGEAGIDVDVSEDAAADLEDERAGADADAAAADSIDDELGAPPESGLEADETDLEDESELESESDVDEAETDAEPAESDAEAESDEDEDEDEDEDAASETETETEAEAEDASADEDEADADDAEPAEDVDLQDYVVDTMTELDDGDGADRSELVETVAADTGASEDEVEDAIQDALMGGRCYEPDDETLKPI